MDAGAINRKFERMTGIYNARQPNEYHLPYNYFSNNKTNNMKYHDVSIHFTLKGQDIKSLVKNIKGFFETSKSIVEFERDVEKPTAQLSHAFMPRAVVEQKGFPLDIVDMLDGIAGHNQHYYFAGLDNMQMSREQMFTAMKNKGGLAIFFAPVIEGVLEEYNIAEKMGVKTMIVTFASEEAK